jgi:DNA-binding NarL/FixJ family response regulator
MNSDHKNHRKKFPAAHGSKCLKVVESLFKTSLKYDRKNNDIVICLRLKEKILADFIRLLLGQPSLVHFFHSETGIASCYKSSSPGKKDSGENNVIIEFASLTSKELVVLGKLADGLRYKEIAADQVICLDTVKSHLKSAYRKLEVGNRKEAAEAYHKLSAVYLQLPSGT